MFAGKAVIAELRGTGSGVGDMVTWKTSDPASGTVVSYTNDGTANTGFVSEQTEPLGQKIDVTDPEPPNEPQTYEQHLFFASDPEWQCSVPDAFYGGFQGRPDHCQNKVLMSFDRSLDQIYGFSSFDTRRIETYAWGTAAVKGSYEATITTEQEAMQWVLSITHKPASGGGSTGADSGYSHQSGPTQWDVRVNAGYDTIEGVFARLDASNPGDPNPPDDYRKEVLDAVKAILSGESECAKWFGEKAIRLAALGAVGEQLKNAPITRYESGDKGGIRMYGNESLFGADGQPFRATDGTPAYMLFSNVEIQSTGPFNSIVSTANKIGGKYPNGQLASRIAQVLHELAHIVYDPKTLKTLIERDGGDENKSVENSRIVLDEHHCREAIDTFLKKH